MSPKKRKKNKQINEIKKEISNNNLNSNSNNSNNSNSNSNLIKKKEEIYSLINLKSNHEELIKFIESGGNKCFELFQYLGTSTHW